MSTTTAIAPAAPGLDEQRLRAAFGGFATGVAFVTAQLEGPPLGLIVSSFSAVSLRPALISFCPSRGSLTWQRMRRAGTFTVHVLEASHHGFVRRAAPPGADRFAEPEVLREAIAAFECELEVEHPAGDHWIVVGRVQAVRLAEGGRPLVYHAGRLGGFTAVE